MSYLVGRLTTINAQRSSFRGREGFAIAVEHLEAKFGEAIITIFVSSLLQMDVSVYLLGSLSTIHYARLRQRVCKSRPEADVRWTRISQNKIDASRKLDFVSLVFFFLPPLSFPCLLPNRQPNRGPQKLPQTAKPPPPLLSCNELHWYGAAEKTGGASVWMQINTGVREELMYVAAARINTCVVSPSGSRGAQKRGEEP